ALAAYTLTIGGVSYTPLAGSLKLDLSVGKKSQAAFTLRTNTSTFFQQFQQVQVYDGAGALVFVGYLNPAQAAKPGFQSSLVWTLTAMGQDYLAKKRVVQASYDTKTPGFIVRDILNSVLAAEGVTAGTIYDGPTCSNTLYCSNTLVCDGNAVLDHIDLFCKAADALDTLVQNASAAGVSYYWSINQVKALDFAPYGIVIGPTIDDTTIDQKRNPPTITFGNANYRNGQYVTGGVAQTLTQTETRVGDGNTTSWAMGFQLASAPTVSINLGNGSGGYLGWSPQTVGLKGTTGAQWYWAQGDNTIAQDSGGTKLRGTVGSTIYNDLLQVVYIGQYPNTAIVYNAAQIAYQADLDGTSGINEEIATDNTLTSASNALTEASNYLNRFSAQGAQLQQATTRTSGFAPAQLCPVNMPYFNLVNTQMLIETVSIQDLDGVNIWYVLTGVQGPYDTTWVDFWSRILSPQAPANSGNAQSSTSTSTLVDLTSTLSPSDTLAISVFACLLTSNSTLCGNSIVVC